MDTRLASIQEQSVKDYLYKHHGIRFEDVGDNDNALIEHILYIIEHECTNIDGSYKTLAEMEKGEDDRILYADDPHLNTVEAYAASLSEANQDRLNEALDLSVSQKVRVISNSEEHLSNLDKDLAEQSNLYALRSLTISGDRIDEANLDKHREEEAKRTLHEYYAALYGVCNNEDLYETNPNARGDIGFDRLSDIHSIIIEAVENNKSEDEIHALLNIDPTIEQHEKAKAIVFMTNNMPLKQWLKDIGTAAQGKCKAAAAMLDAANAKEEELRKKHPLQYAVRNGALSFVAKPLYVGARMTLSARAISKDFQDYKARKIAAGEQYSKRDFLFTDKDARKTFWKKHAPNFARAVPVFGSIYAMGILAHTLKDRENRKAMVEAGKKLVIKLKNTYREAKADESKRNKLRLYTGLAVAALGAAVVIVHCAKEGDTESLNEVVNNIGDSSLDNIPAAPVDSLGINPVDTTQVITPVTPVDSLGINPVDTTQVITPVTPVDSLGINPVDTTQVITPADPAIVTAPEAETQVVNAENASDFQMGKDYMEGYKTPKSDRFFESRNADPRFDHVYPDGTKISAKDYMADVLKKDEAGLLEGKPEGMSAQDYLYHRNMLKAYVQFEGSSKPLSADAVARLKEQLGDAAGIEEGTAITGRHATFLKYMVNSGFSQDKWNDILDGKGTEADIEKLFQSKLGAHAARLLIERDIECGELNAFQMAVVNRGLTDIDMKDNVGYYIGKDSGIGITDNRYIGATIEDTPCNEQIIAEHPRVLGGGKPRVEIIPEKEIIPEAAAEIQQDEFNENITERAVQEEFKEVITEKDTNVVIQAYEHDELNKEDIKNLGGFQVTSQNQLEEVSKEYNLRNNFDNLDGNSAKADMYKHDTGNYEEAGRGGAAVVYLKNEKGGLEMWVMPDTKLEEVAIERGAHDVPVPDGFRYPSSAVADPDKLAIWKAAHGFYTAEDGKEYIRMTEESTDNITTVTNPLDVKETVEKSTQTEVLTEENTVKKNAPVDDIYRQYGKNSR